MDIPISPPAGGTATSVWKRSNRTALGRGVIMTQSTRRGHMVWMAHAIRTTGTRPGNAALSTTRLASKEFGLTIQPRSWPRDSLLLREEEVAHEPDHRIAPLQEQMMMRVPQRHDLRS